MSRRWMTAGIGTLLTMLAVGIGGCGSTGPSFIHPNVDFSHMQRAAVLPFQNLSQDNLADERMHSIFLMEILEQDILLIVDTRETVAVMQSIGITPGDALTPEQVISLGEKLAVDALFFGIVEEYGPSQGDRRRGPEVTAVFGMSETETGVVVWQTQVHETGSSIWRKLFGGGPADLYSVSRETVRKALRSLL